MLILTRKPGQTIRIGNVITIKILSLSPSQVKLGIAAPRSVPVDRGEVALGIDREQRRSA